MKHFITSLAVVALLHLGWAQDIVLKASYYISYPMSNMWFVPYNTDVNMDGFPEVPLFNNALYDIITSSTYSSNRGGFNDEFNNNKLYVSKIRNPGLAEFIYRNYDQSRLVLEDVVTGDVLLSLDDPQGNRSVLLYDYDMDGLEDLLSYSFLDNFVSVYGIATGNPPISPPQDLDIQAVGNDYAITWTPVSNATAYRVLWSSELDGVSFTRIGYTTGTTFTHRNQAGLPQGFYRVMSEDNGTGVVRMVGATPSGNPR